MEKIITPTQIPFTRNDLNRLKILTKALVVLTICLLNNSVAMGSVYAGSEKNSLEFHMFTKTDAPADQQRRVTGRVTDESTGLPLPGVNVVVEGTNTGTATDADGNFSLDIPSGGTSLAFSFIGYGTIKEAIEGRSVINISLQPDTEMLDEIVVVGYGVQRSSDVTGAATRITEDKMNRAIVTSPVEMMQGRISGVIISQENGEPGGGMSVRVRGSNSIRSGQEPLYVIDGVPLDNSDLTPAGATTPGLTGSANKNPISFLNPNDIESIDVLKDASSTAIYGARGANGVILITTKKGKAGAGSLTYDGYAGISNIREKLDLLSSSEFRAYRRPDGTALQDEGADVNWQDEIFRTALTQSHSFTYGGGNANQTYRASIGYLAQEGILRTTGIEKINGKIQLTQNTFNNRLNLTGNLIVSHITDLRAPIGETGGFEGDVILTALKLNPTYPVYNPDGTFHQFSTTQRNPLAMLELTNDKTITDHIIASLAAELQIFQGLRYKLNLGFDRAIIDRRVNQDDELTYLVNNGEANINSLSTNNMLVENYFTWSPEFSGNQNLTLLAGHAYQLFRYSGNELNVNNFTVKDILYTDNLRYGNFSAATTNSFANEDELQSFFGRLNYNLMGKYLFTLTGRLDGSSKFGANNKYGFFPSGAVAWRMDQEDFISSFDAVSTLKFRIGWGRTGNQEIPGKISLLSVGTNTSANGYFNGTLSPGITFLRTPNPDLQWETTTQTNIGVDYGLFNDRLNGAVDVFFKTTRDVLLEITSRAPSATATQWLNIPDLKILNRGVELLVNGIIIQGGDFTWDAGINYSFIHNEVQDLPVTLIETGNASGQGLTGTRVQVITNDQPIGTFYGRVFEGFDDDGMSIYKTDDNGVDVLESLGSALPKHTFSLNSRATFRNFDLSMFWYGMQGNKVYNNTANAIFVKGSLNSGANVTSAVLNSVESPSNSNAFSSRFVEDGSFFRLSNLTLGYTFEPGITWLNSARVYITGNNLLLLTNYTGFDPEVNTDANQNGIPSLGINFTNYPKARTFTIGASLQF